MESAEFGLNVEDSGGSASNAEVSNSTDLDALQKPKPLAPFANIQAFDAEHEHSRMNSDSGCDLEGSEIRRGFVPLRSRFAPHFDAIGILSTGFGTLPPEITRPPPCLPLPAEQNWNASRQGAVTLHPLSSIPPNASELSGAVASSTRISLPVATPAAPNDGAKFTHGKSDFSATASGCQVVPSFSLPPDVDWENVKFKRTLAGLFFSDSRANDAFTLYSQSTAVTSLVGVISGLAYCTICAVVIIGRGWQAFQTVPIVFYLPISAIELLLGLLSLALHKFGPPASPFFARCQHGIACLIAITAVAPLAWRHEVAALLCTDSEDIESTSKCDVPIALLMTGIPAGVLSVLPLNPIYGACCAVSCVLIFAAQHFRREPPPFSGVSALHGGMLVVSCLVGFVQTYVRHDCDARAFVAAAKVLRQGISAKRRARQIDRLVNMLVPAPVLPRLMSETADVGLAIDSTPSGTMLFADMVSFTAWSNGRPASLVAEMLSTVVTRIDRIVASDSVVEKVKTVGDAYWAVAGIPVFHSDHAMQMLRFGSAFNAEVQKMNDEMPDLTDRDVIFRVGVHTGPLSGAVFGVQQISYEIFGHACRMCLKVEAAGQPGQITASESTLRSAGAFAGSSLVDGINTFLLPVGTVEDDDPCLSPQSRVLNQEGEYAENLMHYSAGSGKVRLSIFQVKMPGFAVQLGHPLVTKEATMNDAMRNTSEPWLMLHDDDAAVRGSLGRVSWFPTPQFSDPALEIAFSELSARQASLHRPYACAVQLLLHSVVFLVILGQYVFNNLSPPSESAARFFSSCASPAALSMSAIGTVAAFSCLIFSLLAHSLEGCRRHLLSEWLARISRGHFQHWREIFKIKYSGHLRLLGLFPILEPYFQRTAATEENEGAVAIRAARLLRTADDSEESESDKDPLTPGEQAPLAARRSVDVSESMSMLTHPANRRGSTFLQSRHGVNPFTTDSCAAGVATSAPEQNESLDVPRRELALQEAGLVSEECEVPNTSNFTGISPRGSQRPDFDNLSDANAFYDSWWTKKLGVIGLLAVCSPLAPVSAFLLGYVVVFCAVRLLVDELCILGFGAVYLPSLMMFALPFIAAPASHTVIVLVSLCVFGIPGTASFLSVDGRYREVVAFAAVVVVLIACTTARESRNREYVVELELAHRARERSRRLRSGGAAILSAVVPEHVVPELYVWVRDGMDPAKVITRSVPLAAIVFARLLVPRRRPSKSQTHRLLVPGYRNSTSTRSASISGRLIRKNNAAKSPENSGVEQAREGGAVSLEAAGFTVRAQEGDVDSSEAWLPPAHMRVDALLSHLAYAIDKIKTIGDVILIAGPFRGISSASCPDTLFASFCAAGDATGDALTLKDIDRASVACDAALAAVALINAVSVVQAGLHCGPVAATVQGWSRLSFDVFGDAVNTASRIMTQGATNGGVAASVDFVAALPQAVRQSSLRAAAAPAAAAAKSKWLSSGCRLGDESTIVAKGKGEVSFRSVTRLPRPKSVLERAMAEDIRVDLPTD